jgi:endoglucanase
MKMNRPAFKIDTENPGSEIAGEAAAALAAASILFRADDPTYSQNLLAHAQALFDFADSHRGSYIDVITSARDYYNSSGYHDELVWSALWLYKATGKGDYLQKAESIYRKHFAKASMRWTHSWDDKRYGATIILAQPTKCEPYRATVRRWLNYWTIGDQGERIEYTPGGLAWLDSRGSLRYAGKTAFLAFIHADTVEYVGSRYRDFGRQQVRLHFGSEPRRAQLRGRIWRQSATQCPPSSFPWFTTPSRLAFRKAFK